MDIQTLLLAFLGMAFGLLMLVRGGDWTIDSAVYVARRHGISPMVVGFTIVAFGTSLPELVISVLSNLQGTPGIALGNVLGSNIANILMVIGITSILVPLTVKIRTIMRDMIMMIGATGLLALVMLVGDITRPIGAVMLLILGSYVFLQYKTCDPDEMDMEDVDPDPDSFRSAIHAYIQLLLGLIAISVGAEFLVRGATVSASVIGVPDAVIALSVIAIGTSLPELSTCISAIRKGHSALVIGNILGSNVFNILMIVGVASVIKPIFAGDYAVQLVEFDIWVTAAVSATFALILLTTGKIGRLIGGTFLTAYVAYNIYIYLQYITA